MTCDRCGQALATQILTEIENGQKHIHYRCDTCAKLEAQPKDEILNRPCAQCKKHEGHIKFIQLRAHRRIITYICEHCATKR